MCRIMNTKLPWCVIRGAEKRKFCLKPYFLIYFFVGKLLSLLHFFFFGFIIRYKLLVYVSKDINCSLADGSVMMVSCFHSPVVWFYSFKFDKFWKNLSTISDFLHILLRAIYISQCLFFFLHLTCLFRVIQRLK